jgi:hypothetical protein
MPFVFKSADRVPVMARAEVVAFVEVERPRVTKPRFALVAKRLVELAVVAKLVVEVALVDVELSAVKFCKVDEPVTKRFPNVPSPE